MTSSTSPYLTNHADPTVRAYRLAMQGLKDRELPFMVGGAYALGAFTGVHRFTKDLDLFVQKEHVDPMLALMDELGFETEWTSHIWIAKAKSPAGCIDFIFNAGNGIAPVTEHWFGRAPSADILGVDVLLTPAEEMVWMKAFIMERDRFDGADVMHLFLSRGERLDWEHLLALFAQRWPVLLAQMVLFEFVYPGRPHCIPQAVRENLMARYLGGEVQARLRDERLCNGTLLSRTQYLDDFINGPFLDGRLWPHGTLTPEEAAELSNLERHPGEDERPEEPREKPFEPPPAGPTLP